MPAGRPTKLTPKVVKELEDAFLLGATDTEACLVAGISRQAFYNYCNKNPEFVDKKETLKEMTTFKARKVINLALDDNDVNTAHRVLDRKEGTKIKQEITGKDGGAIQYESMTDQQLDLKLQQLINATSPNTSTED